jgi:hypothetical protein
MKIQTTVQVNEIIEVDIELPYYCQYEDKFYKVVSKEKTIKVSPYEKYSYISSSATWLFEKEIAKATTINSLRFADAYLQAMDNITKLQEVAA